MKLNINLYYVNAFCLLQIILLELHETVHIVTGYIICGCWGTRDFNVWSLCTDCNLNHSLYWIATLTGPLFSFIVMWIGRSWLTSANLKKQALGFSLIFTSLPLGRITEAMRGSGDEMTVAKYLLHNQLSFDQIKIVVVITIALLILPPIVSAYRFVKNKHAWVYRAGYLALPLVFILLYILIGMNSLLHTGFLSTIFIAGTPLLITLHTLFAIVCLWLLRKKLVESFKA